MSYSQKKKIKGTFFNLQGSFPSRPEQKENENILHKTHYLLLQAHLSDIILNKKRVVPSLHQKNFSDKPGISECFQKLTIRARKKTSFQRTSASSCSCSGTEHWLAQQNNIICCETVCKDVFPCSLSSLHWWVREKCKRKKHHASGFLAQIHFHQSRWKEYRGYHEQLHPRWFYFA